MMDREQFLQVFTTWIRIAGKEQTPAIQLLADIGHSSLLERLLDGKPLLPYPPPKSYSYPAYNWCDGREHGVFEIWVGAEEDTVIINQMRWRREQQWADQQYLISYHPNAPLFLLDMAKRTIRLYDPKTWRRV